MTPADLPSVTIRRATPADLDAVVRLRLALLREYPDHPIYGRMHPDADSLARPVFAAQLTSGNEVMFLAERAGEAIGILRAVEAAAAPFLVPERYCYVSSVFVEPSARRQGVLRRLLESAIAWCGERGLGEMRLHSVGSREAASAAWGALGFDVVEQVRVKRLKGSVNDSSRSSVSSVVPGSGSGRRSSRPPAR